MNKIVERIERELGVPGLVSLLAERLTPTDLQSLLLEVYRLRSSQRSAADVLASYESDRFVRPAPVSPRRLLAWEQVASSSLPLQFELLALSPVCPLGTSSVVADVDQNWAVATGRNTEVVSDTTNVLALECAVRRRALLQGDAKSTQDVHLATSHRLLRAQNYQNPGFSAHFSAFALASAGRDQGNMSFETSTLDLHIRFYLNALTMFLDSGVALQVALTDFSQTQYTLLDKQLISPLCARFPTVHFAMEERRTSGQGYYRDLCFHIYAANASGQRKELADGGVVDWTQRLLSNAKERLVISGIGSERLCSEF